MNNPRGPTAFTLLETLLALGLLAMVTAIAFPLLAALGDDRDRIVRAGDRLADASATLDLMQAALLAVSTEPGAAFVGRRDGFEIWTRRARSEGVGERRRLDFRFDAAGRRWVVVSNGPEAPEETELARGVSGVAVRYSDGRAWRATYSGESAPVAVEVQWTWVRSGEASAEQALPPATSRSASATPDVRRVLGVLASGGVAP